MNIFILNENPSISAIEQCDKHVIKMILESAQILFSSHHLKPNLNINYDEISMYKLTHKNHPCNIWTRESLDNYIWLCIHALELCYEYTRRYNKTHKTQEK